MAEDLMALADRLSELGRATIRANQLEELNRERNKSAMVSEHLRLIGLLED